MKRILLYITFLFFGVNVFAQQTPLYSMYMFNEFSYNPAVAGLSKYCHAQVNNRYQFVGIENAPITATITLNGRIKTLPMGWGGMIFNDSQGAFSKFGVYGAYAYHFNISRYSKISMGLNVGVMKYAIDMSKIQFLDEEMNLNESMYTSVRPDASFGVYYDSKNYFVGAAVDQLFNNRIEVYDDTLAVDNTLNRFKSHLNLMIGCKYKLSESLKSESSLVARKVYAAPWQFEISSRITYKETIWGGLSYRTEDAVVLFLGYTYRQAFTFGYSYDITYSKLKVGSRGAHEVFLSFDFNPRGE